MIKVTLPWPPSVNHAWRHVIVKGRARVLLSADCRAYRSAVLIALLEQSARCKPLTGRLSVEIVASPPDRRARDIDGLLKQPLDALQHAGVIENDSAIDRLLIERGPVVPNGRLLVRIKETP